MIKSKGGVFGRNPTFNDVTVDGNMTVSGGMTVTPNADAPTSNVTIGPSAGAALVGGTNNVLIGQGAGDTITGSSGSVAIGQNALSAQVDGATLIGNTVAGTLSTVGTNTGVQLVKDSGVGEMAVYPIVTLTVGAGGDVTAISITNVGSGATVPSGIVFRTNDARIDPAWRGTLVQVPLNTAVGALALAANAEGTGNSALGNSALGSNTTGSNNSAFGSTCLSTNTTGSYNTAVGTTALGANTTGAQNTAVGHWALRRSIDGGGNIGIGFTAGLSDNAGNNLTSTSSSIYIGNDSRPAANAQTNQIVIGTGSRGNGSNTTTIGNSSTLGTYLPNGTLYVQETDNSTNTTNGALVVAGGVGVGGAVNISGGMTVTPNANAPTDNVTIGPSAGAAMQSGSTLNVAVGYNALTSSQNVTQITAIGYNALGAYNSTSNGFNVAVGSQCAQALTSGVNNTFIGGYLCASLLSGGSRNVFVGSSINKYGSSTSNLTSGNDLTLIGFDARPGGNSQFNQIVIGSSTVGNGSNTTTIGNSSTTGTYLAGRVYPGNATGFGTPGIYFVGSNANNGGIVGNVVTADVSSSFKVRNVTGTADVFAVSTPTGHATLSNGNLIFGTVGTGIDFSGTSDPTIPAVAATGAITRTATNVSDGDTVTVGSETYTFKTTLTPADYEVLISAVDAAGSLTNLANAINGTGGSPGDYQVPAANASASAGTIVGSVLPLTALTAGTAGNSIALSEASTQLSVSGVGFLQGGRNAQGATGEILDDYEEGTWTPHFESTAGSLSVVEFVSNAYYTKIGQMVTVQAYINTSYVDTTVGGQVRIAGLPYTVSGHSACAIYSSQWETTGAPASGFVTSGTTMSLWKHNSTSAQSSQMAVSPADMQASGTSRNQLIFTLSYRAA